MSYILPTSTRGQEHLVTLMGSSSTSVCSDFSNSAGSIESTETGSINTESTTTESTSTGSTSTGSTSTGSTRIESTSTGNISTESTNAGSSETGANQMNIAVKTNGVLS